MTPPVFRRLLPILLAAIAGASLAFAVARVDERIGVESGPAGWNRTVPNIPVLLARLAGPPNPPDAGWSLASHASFQAPGQRIQSLEVEAVLPESGHLELVLEGSGAQKGVALQLDRGRSPYSLVTTATPVSLDAAHPLSDWAALECSGDLPAPSEGIVRAKLEREAGGILAAVAVGTAPYAEVRCTWGRPTTGASVRSGLRRIGIRSLAVSELNRPPMVQVAPEPSPGRRGGALLLGALVLGGLAALLRLHPRIRLGGVPIGLVVLPLWFAGPLSGADVSAGLQAVRVVLSQPLWAAVFAPLYAAAGMAMWMGLVVLSRRTEPPGRPLRLGMGAALGLVLVPGYGPIAGLAALAGAGLGEGLHWLTDRWGVVGAGLLPALVVGAWSAMGLAFLLDPRFGMAVTYAGLVGTFAGGLVWANVRRPRGYNAVSLVLMGLMVFFADQGLRWTETGARLTGRSNRAGTGAGSDAEGQLTGTFSSFAALEHGREWSDYPFQNYPVRPSERRQSAVRVVALGGSSTGGAWQNDNLDQFWPAELERRHGPSVQAVNQGVGGWTTLHIRRFLETRLADVDPDVVVLYIGHNDILTESVRPYGELYAAWKRGTDLSVSVSGAMSHVPLYQLARYGLQSAFGSAVQPAVPVDDARDNLQTVAALLAERKVPLLLAREGVAPDPSVLDDYGAMLEALAASSEQVGFVDTGAALTGPGAGTVFLDNCHLTERGHGRVAEAVREALMDEGWIPTGR